MPNKSRNNCIANINTTENSGFDPEGSFEVPQEVYDFYHKTAAKGAEAEKAWEELFKKYSEKYGNEAKELTRLHEKKLPEGWQKCLPVYSPSVSHNA
jgi:transketolase